MKELKELIRDLVRGWRYKRAVRTADRLAKLFKVKYMVLWWGGKFKVVPKQNIKKMVREHRFRKGVRVEDIEKKAVYITL